MMLFIPPTVETLARLADVQEVPENMKYDGTSQPPCFSAPDEVQCGPLQSFSHQAIKITIDDTIRLRITNVKVEAKKIV